MKVDHNTVGKFIIEVTHLIWVPKRKGPQIDWEGEWNGRDDGQQRLPGGADTWTELRGWQRKCGGSEWCSDTGRRRRTECTGTTSKLIVVFCFEQTFFPSAARGRIWRGEGRARETSQAAAVVPVSHGGLDLTTLLAMERGSAKVYNSRQSLMTDFSSLSPYRHQGWPSVSSLVVPETSTGGRAAPGRKIRSISTRGVWGTCGSIRWMRTVGSWTWLCSSGKVSQDLTLQLEWHICGSSAQQNWQLSAERRGT